MIAAHLRLALLAALLAVTPLAGCQVKAPVPDGASVAQTKPAPPRLRRDHPPSTTFQPVLDPSNPALGLLQKSNDALSAFAVDNYGFVDWVAALNKGQIAPRSTVEGGSDMTPLDLDIVMRNTREMPYVVFPHRAHTQWLDCGNCHPALFAQKAGTARILMEDIFRGEACGACHGRVAFPPFYACERCHRVPHGDVKAWW